MLSGCKQNGRPVSWYRTRQRQLEPRGAPAVRQLPEDRGRPSDPRGQPAQAAPRAQAGLRDSGPPFVPVEELGHNQH
jgi:hypothetical protein